MMRNMPLQTTTECVLIVMLLARKHLKKLRMKNLKTESHDNDWCPVFDPLPEGWVAPVTIIPTCLRADMHRQKGYWERFRILE